MKPKVSNAGGKTLAPFDTDIWAFALAFYAKDSVQADCQCAQDDFGLDVNALIFALYRARQGQGFCADTVVTFCKSMTDTIVGPIRRARIALKFPLDNVDKVAASALRETVKAAELEGERLTLDALSRLPPAPAILSPDDALLAVAAASGIRADKHLEALLKRLALSAQSM
jgi:uncharacterized protein (TIGR02444 family)